MARQFALAPLTLIELTPPELVHAATVAGYDAVGLRLSPFRKGEAQHPMLSVGGARAPMLIETEQRLRDGGLQVLDIEVMLLTAERDVTEFAPVFEAGALLGARHALTLIDIADLALAAAQFAALGEVAAPYGLNCALEFAAWLGVGNVHAAAAVVRAADQRNGGVMLDPFHLFRSGGSITDIAALDPAWLRYAQFCDAPAAAPATLAAISEEARFERRMPGDGDLPLREFVAALPPGVPLGLEVPMRQLAQSVGAIERATRVLRAAKRVAGESAARADL
jgi:sugar phosphate isomerase/epimerase